MVTSSGAARRATLSGRHTSGPTKPLARTAWPNRNYANFVAKNWMTSEQKITLGDRVRCVEAVASLFAQLFVPRCTPHLSHLGETEAGSLNGVCHMWWDGFPCLALA